MGRERVVQMAWSIFASVSPNDFLFAEIVRIVVGFGGLTLLISVRVRCFVVSRGHKGMIRVRVRVRLRRSHRD